jgi:hypothetical protein
MYTLTVETLIKACKNNKYIAIRHKDNSLVGINCGIASLKSTQLKNQNRLKNKTNITGYKIINFQEYITLKKPFIS